MEARLALMGDRWEKERQRSLSEEGSHPPLAPPTAGLSPTAGAAAEEREWVRRCQQGDESAFREQMRRYRPRAVYLAAQILREPHEAEDVVQEAFLNVFRSIRQFRGDASFYSWLYRIVVNLCRDRGRRVGTHTAISLEECLDQVSAQGLDSDPRQWQTRLQVEALLAQLSDELRVTLLLRVVAGLSYAEIAEELSVPIGTVCSRLSAAREQFRRLWEAEDL